jgi:hypothetical protein
MDSSSTDTKIAKFTNILKSFNYTDNINYYSLKTAIKTPELRPFFDWFNTNAENQNIITNKQLELFKQKSNVNLICAVQSDYINYDDTDEDDA